MNNFQEIICSNCSAKLDPRGAHNHFDSKLCRAQRAFNDTISTGYHSLAVNVRGESGIAKQYGGYRVSIRTGYRPGGPHKRSEWHNQWWYRFPTSTSKIAFEKAINNSMIDELLTA